MVTASLTLQDLIVLYAENPELNRSSRILVTGDKGDTWDLAVACHVSYENDIVIEFVPAIGTD
jgi:hypothetical protein